MLGHSTSARRQDAAEIPVSVVIFAVGRMDVWFEQWVNIKFCVKLRKTATETLQLLRDAYGDEALSQLKKKAKRTVTWEYRGNSCGCDDGAHRHSKRGIHQLLSGLTETLATVYWLWRELLRRGQEALVVRLNFVFFTASVSELYGQRMYKFCVKYVFIQSHVKQQNNICNSLCCIMCSASDCIENDL
jgi:hypothetical protein